MKWTEERIKELCIEYCNRCDVVFNSPVIINPRLTRTLGRCFSKRVGDISIPFKIEISKKLLEEATEASIKAVIAHECAHYVATAITKERHGHDNTFRFYCQKIGTENCFSIYKDLEWKKSENEVYKYVAYCKECKKFVCGRSRACSITKYPERYTSNCCGAELEIVQNW